MIVLPDITIVSKIYESDHSLIYRGILKSKHQPVILKCLKADYPTPIQLYRYQQEYTITRHLNLEGTLKAYNLINDQNTLILVVEDFGGDSLKLWLKRRSFSIPEFLSLAIQITETLGKIHQNQVIHKDINPAHIVWNPQSGQLKLIDLSIATQLCQENPHLKSPHSLDGTLAYISPEQTGRMNRVIDYRTDFYSLGVTFYEWLTHQLPFIAVDALELVHSLIAKQPIPPHKINPDIPLTVSDIIMKLMAKTPEARYQSAWGIKADLELCLRQWGNGAIQPFNLGYHDIADRLQIPQILYGRESPIQSLLTAFSRIASAPEKHQPLEPPELIIISGYAGIGKSALVQELYPQITQKWGYLISGKFEQLHRDSPYQGLLVACQDLVQQLLTETQSQLHQWRQKILAALGENGQVISDVIPDIELVIGKQPPVPELPPKEAQNRLNFLFQSFLQVFCQKEHPLVLFLDDLQWADIGTLQWLQQIMTQGNTHYLLLIAAYRDNEVSPTHPVMMMISQMKKQGVRINPISLSPLRLNQVNQWIADTLKSEGVSTQKLAELVLQKTQGNPFFIKAFLNSLYTNKLLTIDQTSGVWSWNLEQIRAQTITDNVVEFMIRKIQCLSEPTQRVLKLAACLGNPFDLATLSLIYQNSRQATANHLWHAIQTGLIIPTEQNYNGGKIDYDPDTLTLTYKFAHDRIQQAAYSLITPEEKPKIHWKIGQILYQNPCPEIRKPTTFQIVNQLNLGITATASQNDRDQLAQLNLIAGKKAKVAAAYQPAWNYLSLGIRCLDTDSWLRQYDLTLALYVHAVEVAILSGNIQDMDNLAVIVLKQATCLLDKVKVYEVKIQAYTAQNQPLEAINTALAVLNLLGIRFPQPIKKFHIIRELLKTKLTLVGKSIAGLIDLPIMNDPNKLAAMRILSSVVSAAHFASPDLLPLLVLKQVNLSINYGNTSLSVYAYATYGLILSGELIGDIEMGYQFGQLALGLLDKFQAKELKAKTLLVVNYFIRHWREHLRQTLTPLQDAYAIGLETGDVEYAAYSACVYCYHSYVLGKNLATVEQEMARYSDALSQLNQDITFYYNQLNRQVVLNLMGHSANPCRLIGESYDETKMLPLHLEAKAENICHSLYFYKLVLGYLFHDYQQALDNAKLVEASSDSAMGTIPLAHFYTSLLHLAIYPDASKSQQKQILKKVNANQKLLKKWAKFAPMTHQHKYELVEAERHRVLGETTQAIECYDRAIALAREQEYINEAALANELAGKFYLTWGKKQIAQVYMTNAYYGYLYWGATAKITDLERHYPQLVKRPTNSSGESDKSLSINPSHYVGERLDLAALMKASQAIASEMEWDNLLSTLIKILLEASGAQTGYLILDKGGELLLEASGDVNSEQVTVWQGTRIETYLPASIIYYVARTQNGLIESDVAYKGRFKQDDYIQTHQPKSILCAPVLNQGQLMGIVYLENNLADRVFTRDRLEMVQLLSQIAAIALKNATLYRQIQESQTRLNTYLNAIPVGISVYDAKGQLIYANPVSQELFNPQTQTYHIYRAGTEDLYPMEQLPLMRSLAGEKAWADDLEVHCGDQVILIEASSTPIFDETGTVEYVIAAFQDIRDRKQAETTRLENVRLEQEIRDRQKTATQLERARDAAEAANLAKSTFLANMSHELRTPLNAIIGFSQLMNQDANLSTEQQENLTIIHRSGEHLLTLINQVLDLSKVEAGRMALSEVNFDLHHLLVDIEDMFSLQAKNKGLTLQCDCAADVPQYIFADQVKLRQVLINLTGNAIKFTSSGMVLVKVKCNEKKEASHSVDSRANTINTNAASSQVDTTILSFEVQDTGVGIAEEEIENLFQPFVQTQAGQRVQQGTGLGLTISRKFVRLMGGDISVMSQAVGAKHSRPNVSVLYQRHAANASPNPQSPIPDYTSGTTFKFHIPVRIGDAIASDNQSQSRYVIALAPNQPQYRILVVDDREYNRQLLIKLLKPLGFDVQEAINGQQALDMWDSYSPHLIWMDMRMPIMDGYEATKQIKSTTKGQATAVIALTASVWEEEKAVILSAGCDDFVRKPFQKDVIFEIMAKHLGVGYLYQEKTLPSRPTDGTGESLNFHGLFAAMSKPWIVKLHDAALDADSKLVYKILQDVPKSYAFERETLRNWVKQFEFEKILDLTEQSSVHP